MKWLLLQFPRNVWVLAMTFSLVMTGISLLLFVGGIIGKWLAPDPVLATLPIAVFVVGSALMAIPTALLLQRFTRKYGTYIGLCLSLLASLFGVVAVNLQSFQWLLVCGLCIGMATPFYQQFRFAVIESLAEPKKVGPALSLVMLFNIGGAILGPEIGARGQYLVPGAAEFTGAFLLYGACIVLAMALFSGFQNPPEQTDSSQVQARPLIQVVRQPVFLVALTAAALGYAVMSYLMTSTPLAMHDHYGHSLAEAKWVIQSHLVAMFLPSLFSGWLLQRLGVGMVMLCGGLLYMAVALIALTGVAVLHYWWALVLLGVGWNFLFLSGTSLLPRAYNASERFKAQAVNDFLTFTLQGAASLSAAWVLYQFGWHTQVLTTLPLAALVILAAVVCLRRFEK